MAGKNGQQKWATKLDPKNFSLFQHFGKKKRETIFLKNLC
jgi:hypothetical protein